MTVNQIGDHPDFGTVFFNPNAFANVLCQYDMAITMGYQIELDVKAHSYKMTGTKTGSVYVFSELNKLAVCTCLPISYLLPNISNSSSSSTVLQVASVDGNLKEGIKCHTGTKETDLVLELISDILLQVRSFYVGASLGVHTDKMGHTELVATSELLPQFIHFRDLLTDMGHKVTSPTVPLQGGIFKRRSRTKLLNAG
jgi:hypothetical protein